MDDLDFNSLNINEQNNAINEAEDDYEEIELPSIVESSQILSNPENYIDIKCFFCLQNTRFKKDGVQKFYPIMGDTQKQELDKLVTDSKILGTFKTTGSIQIADWFNSKVVAVMNTMTSRFIEKYQNVTAEDVYTHFCGHIQTTDTIIDQTIEQIHTVSNNIFKSCGLLKQSKTKKSKRNGYNEIIPNEKILKSWTLLHKTKAEYLKLKLQLATIKNEKDKNSK